MGYGTGLFRVKARVGGQGGRHGEYIVCREFKNSGY